MAYNPEIHHRRSIRLKEYDYASPGAYFVTFCTEGRVCVLGEVEAGEMRLSSWGEIAQAWLYEIPRHFQNVMLDESILMPNHGHVIIMINEAGEFRGGETVGGGNVGGGTPPLRPTLGQIMAFHKYQSAKEINRQRNTPGGDFWQRSFYDHIIRNQGELDAIREYIRYNPLNWALDRDHPDYF